MKATYTLGEHILAFIKEATEHTSGDKLLESVERYAKACVEYYAYKAEIQKIETYNHIQLPTSLKKNKDYYGLDMYSLIKKPVKLFPRQMDKSAELRDLLDYKGGKYSNEKIKAIDFERLYKLFNVVHCHSSNWDFHDVLDGRFG